MATFFLAAFLGAAFLATFLGVAFLATFFLAAFLAGLLAAFVATFFLAAFLTGFLGAAFLATFFFIVFFLAGMALCFLRVRVSADFSSGVNTPIENKESIASPRLPPKVYCTSSLSFGSRTTERSTSDL